MEILHRLTVGKEHLKAFSSMGYEWETSVGAASSDDPFVILHISESSSTWEAVKGYVGRKGILDVVETKFSLKELRNAESIMFLSKWFSGFPEPDVQNFGYRSTTYSTKTFCETCGIGLKQIAPFMLTCDPKWGQRKTFQLHWVFDELFVESSIWEKVFKPFGVKCREVLTTKRVPVDSVVQLVIDHFAFLNIEPDHKVHQCKKCNQTKYLPLMNGYRPRAMTIPSPFFKSEQFFGDGGEAYHMLLINHDLFEAMSDANLNCRYWACA